MDGDGDKDVDVDGDGYKDVDVDVDEGEDGDVDGDEDVGWGLDVDEVVTIIATCKFIELCACHDCPQYDEDIAPDERKCIWYKAFLEVKKLKARARARRVK